MLVNTMERLNTMYWDSVRALDDNNLTGIEIVMYEYEGLNYKTKVHQFKALLDCKNLTDNIEPQIRDANNMCEVLSILLRKMTVD